MKLCIEPRSDCSFGSECFHSSNLSSTQIFILGSEFILTSEFILDSDWILGSDFMHPWENWTLGRIYPWLGFSPRLGVYPWLGMILDSDWILSSDFTLGNIGPSVGFSRLRILSWAQIFPFCHFCRRY